MIVKFFKHGTGDAKAAFNYLLNERVEDNTAKVLKGSPKLTLSIIKQMSQKHKYTSGCLSFEELDVNEDTKQTIMDEFEKVIFAGIPQVNRNITWVEHTDKDRLELNFVIPKVELQNFKSFTPYYHKRDVKRISLFRDYTNTHYGFSNPMEQQQTLKLGDMVKYSKNETIKRLDEYISSQIQSGSLTNRNDVIEELIALGYSISRKGKDYISIKIADKRPIRLRGKFYNEEWSDTTIESNSKKIYQELQEEINKHAIYNKEKLYSKIKKRREDDNKRPTKVLRPNC